MNFVETVHVMEFLEMQTDRMIHVIHYLSETIGGRGSCTEEERKAGSYIADCLEELGVQDVKREEFQAIPATYWTFGLSFAVALAGSLAVLLIGASSALMAAAVFNGLGFWGMLAESNLDPSWTRRLLPRAKSQNIVGKFSSAKGSSQKVVLCAHLDTHRTPIFYSSRAWLSLFTMLIGLALLSMAIGAAGYGAAYMLDLSWARWIGLVLIPIQGFALAMCIHADFTPYSPGANDNASGAAIVLELASRITANPFENIEVHFAFTDCEEVGAWGMQDFLERHSSELGPDAFYIIIDQVGSGRVKFLTSDGLLVKHRTHRRAIQVAEQVASLWPELGGYSGKGMAYTDALRATKRGLAALTLVAVPASDVESGAHWHQMSDLLENIVEEDLLKAAEFTWEILKVLDSTHER